MCNTYQYLYQQLSVKNIKPDGRRIPKQKLSPPFYEKDWVLGLGALKCIWGLKGRSSQDLALQVAKIC